MILRGNYAFQLAEELENLEETLNQSIQESVGARARKRSFGKEEKEENEDLRFANDFLILFWQLLVLNG